MTKEAVVDKLSRQFGFGSCKPIRMALYERLGRIVEEHGDEAARIIATVCVDAMGKTDEGKYFAWVVIRRLVDRGILPPLSL